MAMAQQEDSPVMLSAAKHLDAQRERPFAAAQGDNPCEVAGVIPRENSKGISS